LAFFAIERRYAAAVADGMLIYLRHARMMIMLRIHAARDIDILYTLYFHYFIISSRHYVFADAALMHIC